VKARIELPISAQSSYLNPFQRYWKQPHHPYCTWNLRIFSGNWWLLLILSS